MSAWVDDNLVFWQIAVLAFLPAAIPGLIMLCIAALLHRTASCKRSRVLKEELSAEEKKLLEIMTRPARISSYWFRGQ
ncbi:MAG TPA: hypothetical protein VN325_23200 [Steroidobacteraceae bacterium]|nr:hypothetical protein [Steroidobacteraceae bacterium]